MSRLESRNFKVSSRLGLEAMMSRFVSVSVGSVLVPALVAGTGSSPFVYINHINKCV